MAGENSEDEYTTDSDDSDNDFALKNMTPEQAIRALRQRKRVRRPHGRLNSTTAIREMQMVIQERRRNHRAESDWVRSLLQCTPAGWTDKYVVVLP